MIELSLLGTIGLRNASGAEARKLLVRPKIMALLAYLAVGEPRGFHQRNTLLALLWPESDERRARFSLRRALHTIRSELGPESIAVRGDDEIALGADVRCDAIEFDRALDEGRLDEAVLLYKAPLLFGFVVPGLAELQQWLDNRRETFRRRAASAIETLADRAESAGDLRGALEWVQRLDAIAPYEEVVLRRHLSILERRGDRVAAGRVFDRWAARLLAEVDSEPSTETTTLIGRIRGEGAPASVYTPAPTSSAPVTIVANHPLPRRRWARVAVIAGGLAIIGVATAAAIRSVAVSRAARAADPLASRGTAVLPFAYQGSANDAYLGTAMASLVGAAFGSTGPMATIDPHTVTALATPAAIAGDSARDVALRLGARYYVSGSVVIAQRTMRVEASLYDVTRAAKPLGRAVGEGPADSVFAIADRVSRDLVAAGIGTGSPSELGTSSVPALREYLAGEQSLLGARYAEAADHFAAAVHADSAFARAWYRLAYAAGWASESGRALAADKRAIALASRLNPRDRDLLFAWDAFLNGRVVDADRRYEAALSHDGRSIEGWLQLGELRFHWGSMMGYAPLDAAAAFRHVLALSPYQAVALIHLARTLGREQPASDAAFDSVHHAALAQSLDPTERLEMTALAAARHGDVSAQRAVVANALQRPGAAAILVRLLAVVPGGEGMALDLARGLLRSTDTVMVPYAAGEMANIYATHGQFAAASATLDTLEQRAPSQAGEYRAWLALLPLRTVTRDERARAAAALERDRPLAGRRAQWIYLRGALALQLADTGGARAALSRLAALTGTPLDRLLADSYHRLLTAELSMNADPERALAELGENSVEPGSTFPDLGSFINARKRYLRAEMLLRAGRKDDALRWLSTFPDPSSYDAWFLPAALLERAQLESAHDGASAARDYDRFVELWASSDAEVRGIVEAARQHVPG